MDKCLEQLEEQLRAHRIECRRAEPLSRWTTFRIGGPAALFCQPRNKEELSLVIGLCRQTGARRYFLGNGSNVLFDDAGFDGIVIEIGAAFSAIEVQDAQIVAGAGAKLADVCLAAAGHALSGLEFAYGIPGRVGGAVYMNAGAYGGEIKDVLVSATFLDELGGEHTIPAGELEMGHRTSLFAKKTVVHRQRALCADAGERGRDPRENGRLHRPARRKATAGYAQRGQHVQAPAGSVCRRAHRRVRPARVFRGRRVHQ